MARVMNIDVGDLATFIFKKNTEENQLYLNITSLKTHKQLFFFLFDLFCKGLLMLYGSDNRLCLNKLEMSQFDEIKRKLKLAHIELVMEQYDDSTAKLLDLIPEEDSANKETQIIRSSLNAIQSMRDDADLKEYTFNLYMNDTLFCIHFDLAH